MNTAPPARLCKECLTPLPASKRVDALYCSSTCRAATEKRKHRERLNGPSEKLRGSYKVARKDYTNKLEATRLKNNVKYQVAVYGKPTPDPLQMKKDRHRVARAKGYRSGLEVTVAESLKARGCVGFTYEKTKLPYQVPARTSKYTPDYCLPNGIVVETKGIWTLEDRQKMALIKAQYPRLDLRMVFSNVKAKITKLSKTTYAMVCEKLGIPYAAKDIPTEWLNEPPNGASLSIIESLASK